MYEIGLEAEFEARHYLVGDFGPETHLHKHHYRIRVMVAGEDLGADGTLYDIAKLPEWLRAILSALDDQTLNEVPGLQGMNPTVEHLSRYLHERFTEKLRADRGADRITDVKITVWESPTAFSTYRC
ncbi:MAG TPA: 6-carboxytetrahydropterin synthase [Methanomicrobia archaeon]|nr:6-carboxytetrahydropterin synthase [Methanomicrobia archaeon]